jgi:hypothetical protein
VENKSKHYLTRAPAAETEHDTIGFLKDARRHDFCAEPHDKKIL